MDGLRILPPRVSIKITTTQTINEVEPSGIM